jgi:predicted AlkP superfamily phosphohydrolase/phosphomutase
VLHVQENDTGPDDCNHSQFGAFILTATNSTLTGEIEGAHRLDIAPTLLELADSDVPDTMQGRSLMTGAAASATPAISAAGEEIMRPRLSGLGYIS